MPTRHCLFAFLLLISAGPIAHGQYLQTQFEELQEIVPVLSSEERMGVWTERGEQATRPTSPPEGAVEVNADRMEYDSGRGLMIAIGNVRVRQGNDLLTCDYLEYQHETQEAFAQGNVVFDRDGRTWRGPQVRYNFATRQGDFGDFTFYNDPYYIRAEQSESIGENEYMLHNVTFTTCDEERRPEFFIRASRARLTDGTTVRARHVVVYLYGAPVLYTPYWKKDFSKDSNFEIVPGFSSRMGAYLLTAYSFNINPVVRSTTHVDYRSKRGLGLGQRFLWTVPEHNASGNVRFYHMNDDRPIASDRQRQIREGLVESERYRIGLSHNQGFGDRNFLRAEFNYLSDPFILEDFFDREFRRSVQPENRVTLTHRGDNFVASLNFNVRVNDFFGNVNRVPEASLDISRQQIGDTPFYYESAHSAAYLERVFPKQQVGAEDYDALRVDSRHTVLYPTRQFGFLSVIPRVQYRGTWYSETFSTDTMTNEVVTVDAETGIITTTNEVVSVLFDDGAQLRNLYEFGLETSFKAFRVLNERPNYMGRGLRHVQEPYAKYTKVPRPNLRPQNIYQFDRIDRLDERNDILFGTRNKLQTRRGENRIHDFIDLNTYTIYYLDPAENQNDFDDFFFDARLRLATWMMIDFDGAYDWYENEVSQFNAQVAFIGDDRSTFSFEYRYTRDRRQTFAAEMVLFPEDRWSYNTYWRFDLDEGELEEQVYMVSRRFRCTRLGVGIRGRTNLDGEDEWRGWAQVSLLAYPQSEINLGR